MDGAYFWHPYDEGKTLGTIGSENGAILFDEEHPLGARITLEENGYQPWAITCGIYGNMVHTTFASTEMEGLEKYEAMKSELAEFLEYLYSDAVAEDDAFALLGDWCGKFVDKF